MNRRQFVINSLAAAGGAALGLGSARAWGATHGIATGEVTLSGMINDGGMAVTYDTIYNNLPVTYGNTFKLWPATRVPYDQDPLFSIAPPSDESAGSLFLSNVSAANAPYILGYATGSAVSTVCATLAFYVGNSTGVAFTTGIYAAAVSTSRIVLDYATPTGNLPATHGNWMGLWKGQQATMDGSGLLGRYPVDSDAATGSLTMGGLSLTGESIYTVGYFMGPRYTDLAATMAIAV